MVVLVLVGMISTLLMNGFSFVMNLRTTFLTHQESRITDRLFTQWFEGVTSVFSPGFADPDYHGPGFPMDGAPESPPFFEGTQKKIHGLTLSPLGHFPGSPQKITMEIMNTEDEVHLMYTEGKKNAWIIGRWKARQAGFSFLNWNGSWQDRWLIDKADIQQLPKAVLLTVETDQGTKVWFSRLVGRADTKPNLRAIFGDK